MEAPRVCAKQRFMRSKEPKVNTGKDFERNYAFLKKMRSELLLRTKKNPRYSMRSFSRYIGVDQSALVQIMNGKRPLTDKMCLRVAPKLSLSSFETKELMGVTFEEGEDTSHYASIKQETFDLISNWYHYAILELTYIKGFKFSEKSVARVLGITIFEARSAIGRLQKLGFLKVTRGGKWIDSLGDSYDQGNFASEEANKQLQEQILSKAITALYEVDYDKRVQSSMTAAISKEKIPYAKKKIVKFIRDLTKELHGSNRDEVYHLSVSLYPVSKVSSSKRRKK